MVSDGEQVASCTSTGTGANLYVKPTYVDRLDDCVFYHTMELPGFGEISGEWDLRSRIQDYIGGVDVTGKRVLDVGAASGFISFSMEELGAEVVSFDADDASRIACLPFSKSLCTTDRSKWEMETNEFLRKLKNSYWLAHRLCGFRARAFYGDVYNLPEALGQFDVAIVGQILVHLRDPITALTSIARRCKGVLVVAEDMLHSEDTSARLTASSETGPEWLWWHYSVGTYRFLMKIMGFEVLSVTTNHYLCNHQYLPGRAKIDTMVARKLP